MPREWSEKWDAYLSAVLSAFLLVVIVFFTAGNCAVFVGYYLTKSKNAQKLRFQGIYRDEDWLLCEKQTF